MATKRPVGRPPKCDATDVNSILKKIEDQMQKVSANAADNLDKYFKEIHEIASNKSGNVSIKDRVGACKFMIEQAEKFLKEQGSASKQEVEKDEYSSEENKFGLLINTDFIDKSAG